MSEATPLISKNGPNGGNPTAYFLPSHGRKPSSVGDDSLHTAVGEEINRLPQGGVAAEFNPRPVVVGHNLPPGSKLRRAMKQPSMGGGWLGYIAGAFAPVTEDMDEIVDTGEVGTLVLPRKVSLC